MTITDVRIKLVNDNKSLLAFVSIEFDRQFILHDLKLISSKSGDGTTFVAMPSRHRQKRCPKCNRNNRLAANYCSNCSIPLARIVGLEPESLYADIGHPITPECRETIEKTIVAAYNRELELSRKPGYSCTYSWSPNS